MRQLEGLITTAEKLKSLEKKVKGGTDLTKEDTAEVKAVNGQMLFGYDE